MAAVVLRPGETIEPKSLKHWTNSRVDAKFQRVSDVIIMDAFPLTRPAKCSSARCGTLTGAQLERIRVIRRGTVIHAAQSS